MRKRVGVLYAWLPLTVFFLTTSFFFFLPPFSPLDRVSEGR